MFYCEYMNPSFLPDLRSRDDGADVSTAGQNSGILPTKPRSRPESVGDGELTREQQQQKAAFTGNHGGAQTPSRWEDCRALRPGQDAGPWTLCCGQTSPACFHWGKGTLFCCFSTQYFMHLVLFLKLTQTYKTSTPYKNRC